MPPIMNAARMGFRDGGAVEAALRAAAKLTDRNPSDAAKAAGNYRKGKVTIKGIEIAIENPKGSQRSGVDKDGKRWICTLPAHYGYLLGTTGADKDHVDCYIGSDHGSNKVYVVDQIDARTGRFDEHKAMLDFPSKQSALTAYEKAFSDGKGRDRIGAVTEMSVPEFKDWLKSSGTKKPVGKFANGGKVTMPLLPGKKNVGHNIGKLEGECKKRSQAIAIALDVARRGVKRASGGRIGYEEGGEVLPLGIDFTPETVRRHELRAETPVEEVRSANTPMGDLLARYTGSVDVGRNVTGLENFSRDFSGMTDAELASEAYEAGDYGRAAGHGALAVVPTAMAVRPVRALMAAHPYTTGLGFGTVGGLAGGLGDLIPAAQAQEPAPQTPPRLGDTERRPPNPLEPLQRQRDSDAAEVRRLRELETDIARREKVLQGFATQNFQSKTAREAASRPHNDAIANAQAEITRLRLAQDQRRERQESETHQAAEREAWANTPWSKAYPWFPYATGAAGLGLGLWAANRIAGRGVGRFNDAIDSLGADWRAALARAEAARSPAARQQALTEANAISERINAVKKPGSTGPIMAAIGGTELGLATPTLADYLASQALPPGAPLRQSVSHSLNVTNPDVLGRYLLGAGAGLAGGKIITGLARSGMHAPPELGPRTIALNERYRTIESTEPSLPTRLSRRFSPPPLSLEEAAPSRPALPAPEAPLPATREISPASESSRRYHHSQDQPREQGRFIGPPKPARSRRTSKEDDVPPDHDPDTRLLSGRKRGGPVDEALAIARKYADGGSAWRTSVDYALPTLSRPEWQELPLDLAEIDPPPYVLEEVIEPVHARSRRQPVEDRFGLMPTYADGGSTWHLVRTPRSRRLRRDSRTIRVVHYSIRACSLEPTMSAQEQPRVCRCLCVTGGHIRHSCWDR